MSLCWHARIEMQINERICKLKSQKNHPREAERDDNSFANHFFSITKNNKYKNVSLTNSTLCWNHLQRHGIGGLDSGKVEEFQRTGSGSRGDNKHGDIGWCYEIYLDKYIPPGSSSTIRHPSTFHRRAATGSGSGFWLQQEKRMPRNILFKGELLCINY